MPLLKRLLRHIPAVLGVCLLIGSIYVVWNEFRHLKFADITIALHAIPHRALIVAFIWTFFSYGLLTFYDRLGTFYAGHPVSYRRVALASFCAYALSHNLGFAAVSGAAVRYRLYAHWGLTPFQIAKVVAFCSLTFTLGALVLGGTILFLEPEAIPFFGDQFPHWAMYAIGAGMWLIVAVYVTLSRFTGSVRIFNHEIGLPGFRMAFVQVALATADVAFTAGIFYQLLPAAPGLTFLRFLGVYVASYTAGLAANIPGGLGVFDGAMVLGLKAYMPEPAILGAVFVFRLYYYVIPLFIAGSLFAGNELLLRGGAIFSSSRLAKSAAGLARWSEPAFATIAATGAVALSGTVLLTLGIIDPQPDLSWVVPDLGDAFGTAGQYIPSLLGAALIVLSIGLSQRVTLAWGATIALLVVAAGFTAIEGTAYWVPVMLLAATLLLIPFRDAYYRRARVLRGPLQAGTMLPLIALTLCALALAAFEPRVRALDDNSWIDLVFSPEIPNGLRATLALVLTLAAVAIYGLVRPSRVEWLPWQNGGRVWYAALAPSLTSSLASIGEPHAAEGIVLGETGRAGIPFRRTGRVLLGLGDPAGHAADRVSAIWNLRDLAQQEGLDAAVWRASPDLLKVYADLGLTPIPLGPDGLPLPEQPGDTPPACHYLCCVAERDLAQLLPLLPSLANEDRSRAAE